MPTDGTIKNSGMKSTVLTVVLADEQKFKTGAANGDDIDHVIGPIFEGLGPNVADIMVHSYLHSVSANGQYKVKLQSSFDAKDWSSGLDVLTTTSTPGYKVGQPMTDRTYFGLYLRFIVGVSNVAGTAQEDCVVSVTAAIRYHS